MKNVIIWGNHSNTQYVNASHEKVNKGGRPMEASIAVGDEALLKGDFLSDEWVSVVVPSDGSYDVPPGLVFSFPITLSPDGEWKIVRGLRWDDFAKEIIELESERDEALSVCEKSWEVRGGQQSTNRTSTEEDRRIYL